MCDRAVVGLQRATLWESSSPVQLWFPGYDLRLIYVAHPRKALTQKQTRSAPGTRTLDYKGKQCRFPGKVGGGSSQSANMHQRRNLLALAAALTP